MASRGTAPRSGSRPAGGCTRCRGWFGSSRRPGIRRTARSRSRFAVWQDSYEAEQHLLHQGRADEPVCWTLTGFASGYLSRAHGRDIYCMEDRCRGKGDAVCRLVGRPLEEWGDAFADHLPFYEQGLHGSLARPADRRTEARRAHAARPPACARSSRRGGHGQRFRPRRAERRRWSGCSTWRVASPRSTPRCSSPARAASARSASRG